MAEWNYNNMNHISLNLPPSFQLSNNSSGSYFNHPINANFNFSDPSQSMYYKPHFGSDSPCGTFNLPNSSSHELSLENKIVNQHVLPMVPEPQQEWLNMVNQRIRDQHFLDNFIQARVVPRNCLPSVQMNEYRELVKEAERLSNCLEVTKQASDASSNPKNSRELKQIQERLEFLKEQIEELATSKEINEKLTKKKEKREWLNRKKERKRQEVKDAIVRRENLHKLIDVQTEAIRRKEWNRKRNQMAKREVDVILGEVRRKRSDTRRIHELLLSLRELRALRARSLALQHALFSKQEDTDHFNNAIDKLDLTIKKKSACYEEEEKALTFTIKEHQHVEFGDSKETDDAIKKLWSKRALKQSTRY